MGRFLIRIAGVLPIFLVASCGGKSSMPRLPIPLQTFVLHDILGGAGGRAIWVKEDKTAVLQIVTPSKDGGGLVEKRYYFELTADEFGGMEKMAGTHRLLEIKTVNRFGIPDEAHPIILAVTKQGDKVRVSKWANDSNSDFDSLYAYLFSLCTVPKGKVPEFDGEFNWNWRPNGFDSPF